MKLALECPRHSFSLSLLRAIHLAKATQWLGGAELEAELVDPMAACQSHPSAWLFSYSLVFAEGKGLFPQVWLFTVTTCCPFMSPSSLFVSLPLSKDVSLKPFHTHLVLVDFSPLSPLSLPWPHPS